ncbi:MAG TPA: hypothetical protein VGL97_23135 [Bryobacteraceae bacterium]|jgi:hypothetical protein
MNVAQHAEKILKAWNVADPAGFERELESALRSCRRQMPLDHLEDEQREVLESVIERLRAEAGGAGRASDWQPWTQRELAPSQGLNAGFSLLEHLSQRAA